MDVALREEIKEGKATILCSLDGNSPKEYEIEIEKVYTENNYDNKSMKIKVTDEELLEKTGGIIQGMSGSPIIQNGKFVGAVTHVLVNNPTEGYAVFGDIMLKQVREVE
jgi:stage IV sporulation protein B